MKKLFLLVIVVLFFCCPAEGKVRVFVFTDINIDSGDPDDRQSLVHLLWYSDVLEIEGIIPERLNAGGYEACQLAMDAYRNDFTSYGFKKMGFAEPNRIGNVISSGKDMTYKLFNDAALKSDKPLFVLVWGNMAGVRDCLFKRPELASHIRLITIGTGLMLERNIKHIPASWKKEGPCQQMNWNGKGRNDIYKNNRFDDMWWLEMNWTYEGMFTGPQPKQMLAKLSVFGAMGRHLKEVVRKESWAQYFRVGDTPSVLYVIDKNHDLDDPTQSSWAGRFVRPFQDKRKNYFTDSCGSLDWDYADPCRTWDKHVQVRNTAVATLEKRRPEMYQELLVKLARIYNHSKGK